MSKNEKYLLILVVILIVIAVWMSQCDKKHEYLEPVSMSSGTNFNNTIVYPPQTNRVYPTETVAYPTETGAYPTETVAYPTETSVARVVSYPTETVARNVVSYPTETVARNVVSYPTETVARNVVTKNRLLCINPDDIKNFIGDIQQDLKMLSDRHGNYFLTKYKNYLVEINSHRV
jgi:hypothetical protein